MKRLTQLLVLMILLGSCAPTHKMVMPDRCKPVKQKKYKMVEPHYKKPEREKHQSFLWKYWGPGRRDKIENR